jgi:hypothetical protein
MMQRILICVGRFLAVMAAWAVCIGAYGGAFQAVKYIVSMPDETQRVAGWWVFGILEMVGTGLMYRIVCTEEDGLSWHDLLGIPLIGYVVGVLMATIGPFFFAICVMESMFPSFPLQPAARKPKKVIIRCNQSR